LADFAVEALAVEKTLLTMSSPAVAVSRDGDVDVVVAVAWLASAAGLVGIAKVVVSANIAPRT